MVTYVYDSNALKIHVDGSSLILNGFSAGCAGIVEYPEQCNLPDLKLGWSYNTSTIGQMELRAIYNALVWINKNTKELKSLNITRIIIINDREDNVESFNNRMQLWQKNGWKGKDGKDIKNLNAWKEVLRERAKIQFALKAVWEKGKKTEYAKEVDKIAKKNSAKITIDKFNTDMTPRKVGRSITGTLFELVEIPKNITNGIIRIYYHFLVNNKKNSEVDIRFELIVNMKVVGKFRAICTDKLNREFISRHHYYEASFNHDKSYSILQSVVEINGNQLEEMKKEIKAIYGRS